MDLVQCAACGNTSFSRKHYYKKFNDDYYIHYTALVCDSCGEPLQWMTSDKVLGGF